MNYYKKNGWGYNDSYYKFNENGNVVFSGNRYEFCGVEMPNLVPYVKELIGFDKNITTKFQKKIPCPKAIVNEEFLADIKSKFIYFLLIILKKLDVN